MLRAAARFLAEKGRRVRGSWELPAFRAASPLASVLLRLLAALAIAVSGFAFGALALVLPPPVLVLAQTGLLAGVFLVVTIRSENRTSETGDSVNG